MAELALARQSRSEQNAPASPRRSSRGPKKAPSFLDRAFTFGGLALILFALLVLSPWRDSFLSPTIAHFFGSPRDQRASRQGAPLRGGRPGPYRQQLRVPTS